MEKWQAHNAFSSHIQQQFFSASILWIFLRNGVQCDTEKKTKTHAQRTHTWPYIVKNGLWHKIIPWTWIGIKRKKRTLHWICNSNTYCAHPANTCLYICRPYRNEWHTHTYHKVFQCVSSVCSTQISAIANTHTQPHTNTQPYFRMVYGVHSTHRDVPLVGTTTVTLAESKRKL